jgi:hypothetical protein
MRSVRSLRARGKKAKLYETPGTQEKNIGKRWSGCVGYFANFRRNDYQLDIKETTHCIIEQLRSRTSSIK